MRRTLYGLFGRPVHHSASPAMMNAAFAALNLHAVYLPFCVPDAQLGSALQGLFTLGARGVNVTIPHKESILSFMDELTSEARFVGAVNTVLLEPEVHRLTGHNTDVVGWWRSIADVWQSNVSLVSAPKAAVLGAGGAARAVISALALYAPQSEVHIVARRVEAASRLADHFANQLSITVEPWWDRHRVIGKAQLIVNTTPVGMWPHGNISPVDDACCFHQGQVVQDVVYRPAQTLFLTQAQARGACIVGGLDMLLYQGLAAVEFWLGRTPPVSVMRASLEAFLA